MRPPVPAQGDEHAAAVPVDEPERLVQLESHALTVPAGWTGVTRVGSRQVEPTPGHPHTGPDQLVDGAVGGQGRVVAHGHAPGSVPRPAQGHRAGRVHPVEGHRVGDHGGVTGILLERLEDVDDTGRRLALDGQVGHQRGPAVGDGPTTPRCPAWSGDR